MSALLDVRNLVVRYGGIEAVRGVSLTVNDGEIVTVIGSNGAGKSSLLNALVGWVKPRAGEIVFSGQAIAGWPTHRISRKGVGMVPEGRRLFGDMSVHENLLLGAHRRNDRQNIADDVRRVYTLFPRLQERHGQLASTLSGGEQQMVAIGRALMSRVQLLLLDEPSLGLAPLMVKMITEAIREVHERENIAIILVEQNARMALSLAHRAYVMETGKVVAEGPSAEIASSAMVRKAYLGM